MKIIILVIGFLLLSGCGNDNDNKIESTALGKNVFNKNCAVCHGKQAQGLVKNWKKPIAGVYPAPPLNGTAHAWHHSPKILLETINSGGTKLGGTMPAFNNKLNKEEKQAILDYLHSLWPENIQKKYNTRFKL
jgi:mono/diheme cytochrome c family protein